MTGGIPSGAAIAAAAAPHMTRLQLELGGSNPAIVRADADVAATGEALARGITKLSGQWCEGPRRILVARVDPRRPGRRHPRRARARPRSARRSTPPPSAARSRTPRTSPRCGRSSRRSSPAAASRVEAGDLPAEGFRLRPTLVLGIAPDDALEEIFGPVVTFHPVRRRRRGAGGRQPRRGRPRGLRLRPRRGGGRCASAGGCAAARSSSTAPRCSTCAPGSVQSFFGRSGIGGHGAPSLFDFFRGVRIVGFDDPALAF